MKHKRPPQFELPIPDEPFALVPQTAIDGDRLTRAREQSAADRADSQKQQLSFHPAPSTQTHL